MEKLLGNRKLLQELCQNDSPTNLENRRAVQARRIQSLGNFGTFQKYYILS